MTAGLGIEVRTIRSGELDAVYRLTHDCYVAQGYCTPRPDRRLVHYPHLDNIRETTVLVAVRGREIIGSLSLTVDGARGLPVDSDFKATVDGIRRWGIPVGAAWRIVVKPGFRDGEVLTALINAGVLKSARLPAKVWLFTLNPKHERGYHLMLNLKTIARSRETRGLLNAPAVLMMGGVDEAVQLLARIEKRKASAASPRLYAMKQTDILVLGEAAPPLEPGALAPAIRLDAARKYPRHALPLAMAVSVASLLIVAASASFSGSGSPGHMSPPQPSGSVQASVQQVLPAPRANLSLPPQALQFQPQIRPTRAASITRPAGGPRTAHRGPRTAHRGPRTAQGRARHFRVVSGVLPEQTAERRVKALTKIRRGPPPRIVPLPPAQAFLDYGEFGSEKDARLLAKRVRTLGFTAAIVGW